MLAGFWLAGSLVAVGVGLVAILLVGNGLTTEANPRLSEAQVRQELRAAEARAAADGTSASASATPSAPPPTAPTPGASPTPSQPLAWQIPGVATVVARCTGDQVSVVSASPLSGFRVDDVPDEADDVLRIGFDSDSRRVEVSLSCAGGAPQLDRTRGRGQGRRVVGRRLGRVGEFRRVE